MAFKLPSLNRKTLSIGVDLGADAAKLVCLLSSKSGYKLVAHALVKKTEMHGLKEFLNHPDFKQSNIRIAIQDPNLKVQKLSLPIVPKEELPQMISWSLRDAINIPLEEYVVRYHSCTDASNGKNQDFIAFAMERKIIDQWTKFIHESGITQPDAAEPDIQSLANLVSFNYELKEGDRYALIDVGRTQSQMAVISRNGIEFYRPFSGIGGDHLANNLSHEIGVTSEESEKLLLELSIQGTCEKQDVVKDIIARYCAKFSVQAQYAIESYLALEKNKPITNIILSGGGAQLMGLKEQIQDTLHFPTDLIDPFSRLDIGKFERSGFENSKTLYAVAAGLAL